MGENLGAVYLEVRAEMSKLSGDFKKAFDSAGKEATTFGSKLKSTLSNPQIMAGVGAAVSVVGGVLTHLGDQLDQANKQLEQAAKDAGISMDELRSKTEGLNSKMENLGHTNAQTAGAEQIFIQAGRPASEIMKDMALAADLAAAKHISLGEAATKIVKVYAGSGRILKEFGITATVSSNAAASAAKAHQAAVDALAKAQENLAMLEQREGAAATDAANRHAAAQDKARAAVDAAQASLSRLEAQTGKHAATTAQLDRAKASLIKAEANLSAAQNVTTGTMSSEVAKAQALQKAHEAVSAAQDKVTASAGAMAKAHGAAGNAVDELAKKVQGQGKASMDTFGGRIEVLKTKLTDLVAHLGAKVGPAITALGPVMSATAMLMNSGALSMVASGAKAAAGWIADMASMSAASIASAAATVAAFWPIILALAAIIVVVVVVWKNWKTIWGFIKDVIHDAWDWIKKHVDLIVALVALPLLPLKLLWDHWKQVWGWIKGAVNDASKVIGDAIGTVEGFFTDLWNVIEGIWNKIKAVFDAIGNGISSVGSTIGKLNPFGGNFLAFAAGGTVPGPQGAPRLIIAHGGEVVSKPGLDGTPSGGGGGGNTIIVQGSIWAEHDIMNLVKQTNDRTARYNGPRYSNG